MSELLFRQDAYLQHCSAVVTQVAEQGIQLDRTIFYPNGGGQPGDSGLLRLADGREIAIVNSVKGEAADEVWHVPAEGSILPAVGEAVQLELDWARRYTYMRYHTALHPPAVRGGGCAGDGWPGRARQGAARLRGRDGSAG
jgi:misacylated tRNA(Ala) deacylase